jgi:hypothetical protein
VTLLFFLVWLAAGAARVSFLLTPSCLQLVSFNFQSDEIAAPCVPCDDSVISGLMPQVRALAAAQVEATVS